MAVLWRMTASIAESARMRASVDIKAATNKDAIISALQVFNLAFDEIEGG
jgi:hypothetical protein